MTLEQEKATRIKYQNLVYEVCSLLDTRKRPCPDCNIENVVPRLKALLQRVPELERTFKHDQMMLEVHDHIQDQMKQLLLADGQPDPKGDLVGALRTRLRENPQGVLQPWVAALGLRHQGVLMACVRGCDNVPKDDATKLLARCLRAVMLRSFDPKPSSFIEHVASDELGRRMIAVLKNHDHYPLHYLMHLLHGSEIVGYKHPEFPVREGWHWFYVNLATCFHLTPETEAALDERLGADEEKFAAHARIT